MNKTTASTLSEHLLREAGKFHFYPNRERRTRANLQARKMLDAWLRELVEWRKTFAPKSAPEWDEIVTAPVILDELYCRDLLQAVPGIVERTRNLSQLTLPELGDPDSITYLKEASNCYILGLPQAAVALARAAVETRLRAASSRVFGKTAVRAAEFIQIIDTFAARGRLLSREGQGLAHKVREAANQVLHERPTNSAAALSVIEAARTVILQLRGR